MGKPEGKTPLGRRWHRCDIDIKMDLRTVGWEDMDWIDLTQDRNRWQCVVKASMNLLVPNSVENFVTS
jgi:hypothetical protein